jgi:hypothetical protein
MWFSPPSRRASTDGRSADRDRSSWCTRAPRCTRDRCAGGTARRSWGAGHHGGDLHRLDRETRQALDVDHGAPQRLRHLFPRGLAAEGLSQVALRLRPVAALVRRTRAAGSVGRLASAQLWSPNPPDGMVEKRTQAGSNFVTASSPIPLLTRSGSQPRPQYCASRGSRPAEGGARTSACWRPRRPPRADTGGPPRLSGARRRRGRIEVGGVRSGASSHRPRGAGAAAVRCVTCPRWGRPFGGVGGYGPTIRQGSRRPENAPPAICPELRLAGAGLTARDPRLEPASPPRVGGPDVGALDPGLPDREASFLRQLAPAEPRPRRLGCPMRLAQEETLARRRTGAPDPGGRSSLG